MKQIICNSCGQPVDPELKRLRDALMSIGPKWPGEVVYAMHTAMAKLNIRKGRRPAAELLMNHFFNELCRKGDLNQYRISNHETTR